MLEVRVLGHQTPSLLLARIDRLLPLSSIVFLW
jgi:hypothetical protein